MNERIRKLAEEAGFYFYDMHNVNGEDLGETIEADSWAAADKFAELILLECASLFENVYTDTCPQQRIDKTIKQHFGVE